VAKYIKLLSGYYKQKGDKIQAKNGANYNGDV
jgi:hypothetical protein